MLALRSRSLQLSRHNLLALTSSRSQYTPGGGIQNATQVAKRREELAKPFEEENPADYTLFGNKKKPKSSVFHYTDRSAGKGYSDYSSQVYVNRPYIWPPLRKLFNFNFCLVLVGLVICFMDVDSAAAYFGQVTKAFRPEASDNYVHQDDEPEIEEEDAAPKKKKKKMGFRERRIVEYENRIRSYSTPDKIFRYFATLKVYNDDDSTRNFEVYMTPEDFVRSLTPGVMQPRNLGLDKFKVYHPDKYRHDFSDTNSIFYKLGEHGLISFSDYLFLMTLLSTPPSEFNLAFRIFDLNGDGELDQYEFEKVQDLVISQTTVGQRHRDHITPSFSFRKQTNSALRSYFFGKDGKKKLDVNTFLQFQAHLHRDILKIEFQRRDPESNANDEGVISEVSFAELLLMHANLPEKRQKKMLRRVKRKYKELPDKKGISFQELSAFFCFLYFIESVDLALHFYKLAGISLSRELIQLVAKKIANVEITDNVLDVVIALFDENGDGELSHKEFVNIMKRRIQRGLERPKNVGLVKLVDAMADCAKRQFLLAATS
ncbi:hypothetical protein QR680_003604 [Steinernema hermaphroditum]|uniref:EF-hand domain-containing protein n=1 Tax=Steinernema hermaphroditum TaxID=289476 RepID=A0AA39LRU0_9BILA|nr:hypothetical protein QR680_003604 [Steinernema hermaphroditum]